MAPCKHDIAPGLGGQTPYPVLQIFHSDAQAVATPSVRALVTNSNVTVRKVSENELILYANFICY